MLELSPTSVALSSSYVDHLQVIIHRVNAIGWHKAVYGITLPLPLVAHTLPYFQRHGENRSIYESELPSYHIPKPMVLSWAGFPVDPRAYKPLKGFLGDEYENKPTFKHKRAGGEQDDDAEATTGRASKHTKTEQRVQGAGMRHAVEEETASQSEEGQVQIKRRFDTSAAHVLSGEIRLAPPATLVHPSTSRPQQGPTTTKKSLAKGSVPIKAANEEDAGREGAVPELLLVNKWYFGGGLDAKGWWVSE
ncbi:hypothetical protein D9756_004569 [Leucocoprinus leucothites]|uniref:Uncharacterized protein n=1 Tax=Leucocoprinus leucothites TaxID=201217 RepID=A0A8H5LKF2_9AGAR|nr:hypothetical protein D9756_004569 [Leucoagaricus leucothites]